MSLASESLTLPDISSLIQSQPPPYIPKTLPNIARGIVLLQAQIRGALQRLKALRCLYADYPDFRDHEKRTHRQGLLRWSRGAIRQFYYLGILKRFCRYLVRHYRRRQAMRKICRTVANWWEVFKLNRDYVVANFGSRLYFCEKDLHVMQFVLLSVIRPHDHVVAKPPREYRALNEGEQFYRMKRSFIRREKIGGEIEEHAVVCRAASSIRRYADRQQLLHFKRLRFRQSHIKSELQPKANYGTRFHLNLDLLTSYYCENVNVLTRFYIALWRAGALVKLFCEDQLIQIAAANEIKRFWLGRYYRIKLIGIIINRFIEKRAAVALQRWWRNNVGLLRRFRILSRVLSSVRSIHDSTLFIDLITFYQIITKEVLPKVPYSGSLYPELRGIPLVNIRGEVFFQSQERYRKNMFAEFTTIAPPAPVHREFIKWPAFLRLSKDKRYDSALYRSVRINYEGKCEQTITAFDLGSDARVLFNLLCTGCKVGIKEFEVTAQHRFRAVQLSFPTVSEARARAMMLAIVTLDLSSECGVELCDYGGVTNRIPALRNMYNDILELENSSEKEKIARLIDNFSMISARELLELNLTGSVLEQAESFIRLANADGNMPKWLLQESRRPEDVVKFQFMHESLCYHHGVEPRRGRSSNLVRPWAAMIPSMPTGVASKQRLDISAAKYKLSSPIDASGRDYWNQWEAGLLKTGIDENNLRVTPLRLGHGDDDSGENSEIPADLPNMLLFSDEFEEPCGPKASGTDRLNKKVLSVEKMLLWCAESGGRRTSKGGHAEINKKMGLLAFKVESIRATYESERAAADRREETRQYKLFHLEPEHKSSPRPLSPFFPGSALYKPKVQLFEENTEFASNKNLSQEVELENRDKTHSATEDLLLLKAHEAQELRLSLQEIQRAKSAADKESIEERRLRVLEMRNSPRSKDARRELKSRSGTLRREERAKIEEVIELADAARRAELKEMADTQKRARQTASLRQQLLRHSRTGASILNTISKTSDRAVIHNMKKKRLSRSTDVPIQFSIDATKQEVQSPSSPQSPTVSSQGAFRLLMQKKPKADDFTDSVILSPVNKDRLNRNEAMLIGDDLC